MTTPLTVENSPYFKQQSTLSRTSSSGLPTSVAGGLNSAFLKAAAVIDKIPAPIKRLAGFVVVGGALGAAGGASARACFTGVPYLEDIFHVVKGNETTIGAKIAAYVGTMVDYSVPGAIAGFGAGVWDQTRTFVEGRASSPKTATPHSVHSTQTPTAPQRATEMNPRRSKTTRIETSTSTQMPAAEVKSSEKPVKAD